MGQNKGLHINVKGSVQGVGYRYYCREAAEQYGLKGFVRNLPDGSVELEVFGDAGLITGFVDHITRRDGSFIIEDFTKVDIPDDGRYKDFYIQMYPGY